MYSFKGSQSNKNHAFPSKRCISNEKTCYCYTFYNEYHTQYLEITCNMKTLFVKKYQLILCFHPLLHYSCCFLNTNSAITWQLIRTARMLQAEWWQVCREAWLRGQRKMRQVMGAFGLLDFTMLRSVLAWRMF
jgi:hypothetical protein